jgi:copper chaperone CopZ
MKDQCVLYNTDNYKSTIHNTAQDILAKISIIIIEYMRLISEKINIKNKQYYIFIFERGIETLIHVFTMIFYYTKNLDLTFYHSQKAYYFYIEFIEQISDDNITFLKLSSKDAVMFVYKKTIFDLNNERKKTMLLLTSDENTVIAYTDNHMHIYKKFVSYILNHSDFLYENKLEYINSCCDKMQKCISILNKYKIRQNYIECIYLFTNLLTQIDGVKSVSIFFDTIEEFVKRLKDLTIKKKIINEKIINEKIINEKINDYSINNNNFVNELIDYILTE